MYLDGHQEIHIPGAPTTCSSADPASCTDRSRTPRLQSGYSLLAQPKFHNQQKLPAAAAPLHLSVFRHLALTSEAREAKEERLAPRRGKGKRLTFHITPNVSVRPLVLVDQLDHAEQILLLQLLQRLRDLLVIVLLLRALAATSTDRGSLLLAGPVLIGGQGSCLAQPLLERLRGVLEGDGVCALVPGLREVEVVHDGLELGLLRGVAVDADLELTPALVAAVEGCLGVSYVSYQPLSREARRHAPGSHH